VETAQRQAEDASLSNRINEEAAQRQAEDASLSNRINQEAAERKAEDASLSNRINVEAAQRQAEDASLSNRINEEAAQRQAEDASLSNRINEEAAQRQAEDASLSNRINEEAAQRQAEDASLSNRINVETAQRQAEDASLSNRISQEVSDRIANDITAGNIDGATGTVTLTKNNGDVITVGNVCDSRLDSASFDAAAGKLTFTVTDHYNQDAQKTIEVNDIASKTALENEAAIRYNYDQAIINDYTTKTNYLDNRISNLSGRVDKVGAGAAALAALHPLDFDPDDKLSFAAGVGNYSGATAAAIGAFYRPNERVMFSIGGTTGNGENMVNAGVSFALGKGGKINNSRVAMAHEINDLRQQVAYLTAMVAQLSEFAGYQFNDLKPFPDTPDNHWAYEYVAKLAAEGIVEGYPNGNFDGNFDGSRTMTRYEFAAMLYRALEKGFRLDARIIDEFEPELGRLSVERIRGEQNQKNKIERVRVNDSTPDRDAYGGKISVGKTWP
ncbi:MAG: YadA-like family protein, partial [Selenomonadales bacterium]|nr:YadA-like family protein [Selenomonadales bacterium]